MSQEKFQVSSVIESVATRVDNTIKIVVSTQELSPEQSTSLFALKGKQGWLLFSENEIKEMDIPDVNAPEFKADKSPSQRLRNTLYVYWESNTDKSKPFEGWYRDWIEKKIGEIKDYLPEKK